MKTPTMEERFPFFTDTSPLFEDETPPSIGKTPINPQQTAANNVVFLPIGQIFPEKSPTAPENHNKIIRLAESIKRYGILHPLTVRPISSEIGPIGYIIIDGNQRFCAARLSDCRKIPCIILSEDSKECEEAAILAKLKQKSLHMFDKARAFQHLLDHYHLTQEDLARKLRISQAAIANKLRLLQLSYTEQNEILQLGLTERHARAILRLKDTRERREILASLRARKLTVAATEALVESILTKKSPDLPPVTAYTPTEAPITGFVPQKFVLRDLQPLYTSIEKTLAIFRKTGASATCSHQETAEMVEICIKIPKIKC